MRKRSIKPVHISQYSEKIVPGSGKKLHNGDDNFIFTEDGRFAAVIDGVSHKTVPNVNGTIGERISPIGTLVADAIEYISQIEELKEKEITLERFISEVHGYLRRYYASMGLESYFEEHPEQIPEATLAVYLTNQNKEKGIDQSKMWLVGDCYGIYDGIVVEEPLKTDEVHVDLRNEIIETLQQIGFEDSSIYNMERQIKKIMDTPEIIESYIRAGSILYTNGKNGRNARSLTKQDCERLQNLYTKMKEMIEKAIVFAGFEGEIGQIKNIKELQRRVKNNDGTTWGYSVINHGVEDVSALVRNCKEINVPRDVKKITLCTDGYPSHIFQDPMYADLVEKEDRDLPVEEKISQRMAFANMLAKGVHMHNVYEGTHTIGPDDRTKITFELVYQEREKDERESTIGAR